ncbi:hypothetical protein EXT70_20460 [Dickeya dadantii]|nr:hypothetical protein [Dickeya dadantii]
MIILWWLFCELEVFGFFVIFITFLVFATAVDGVKQEAGNRAFHAVTATGNGEVLLLREEERPVNPE